MNILNFQTRIMKTNETPRIPQENQPNHENHTIPCENHANHENI